MPRSKQPKRVIRRQLTEDERAQLAELLKAVPTQRIVIHDWQSEAGIAFLDAMGTLMEDGVVLRWAAEELNFAGSSMHTAIMKVRKLKRAGLLTP